MKAVFKTVIILHASLLLAQGAKDLEELSEQELIQDILEGAGEFSGPTFKYKSFDDSEYRDEPVFSPTRWRYVYGN